MKTNYLIIVAAFTCFLGNVNAQSPNWQWAKSMGETGSDYGYSITTDAFGNVYTTGSFADTVDFDPGAGVFKLTGGGGFISKLDNAGNFIWAKAIGGGGSSIAIDTGGSGEIYTTGIFSGTVDFDPGGGTFNLTSAGVMAIFISKLDSSGNFVWAKQFSGTNGVKAASQSITIDASGSVYTTGHFQGTYDFNPGVGTFNLYSSQRGIFISKLDSSGNFVWAKAMSGIYDAYGYSIALDASGNIYTTGSFVGTVDFDPGAGTFNLTSPGTGGFGNYPSDIFISKLDSAGNFVWAKQMGGTGDDNSMSINIDHGGSGAIYTTGFYSGTVDFDPDTSVGNVFNLTGGGNFISKLDSSGNFVWAKRIGGGLFGGHNFVGHASGYSIATDTFGNVYTTGTFVGTQDFDPGAGTFNLTSAGGTDIFISKLDSSGNFFWAKAVGGTGYDYGESIALDASGSVHVAGYFRSTSIMFGSTTFTNAGASDLFIAKFDTTVVTGTNEIENFDNRILLFPNPATNHFTIALESDNKKAEVTIADITGKIVYTTNANETHKIEVNTSEFAEGIYVVHIQSADFIGMKRLIVIK